MLIGVIAVVAGCGGGAVGPATTRVISRSTAHAAPHSARTAAPRPASSSVAHDPVVALIADHLERAPAALALAEAVCNDALTRPGASSQAWTICGVVAGRMDRQDVARERFMRATQIAPAALEAWLNLGEIDLALRDWPAALASFERAMPADAAGRPLLTYRATIGIARAARGAGRFVEAAAAAERARTTRPTEPEAYFELGLLASLGEPSGAESAESWFRLFLVRAGFRPDLAWAVDAVRVCQRTRSGIRQGLTRTRTPDCLARVAADRSLPCPSVEDSVAAALREAATMQAEAARIQQAAEDAERRRLATPPP